MTSTASRDLTLSEAGPAGDCATRPPAAGVSRRGPLRGAFAHVGPGPHPFLVLIQFNILVGPISNFSESKGKRQKGENLGTLRKPWGTRRTGSEPRPAAQPVLRSKHAGGGRVRRAAKHLARPHPAARRGAGTARQGRAGQDPSPGSPRRPSPAASRGGRQESSSPRSGRSPSRGKGSRGLWLQPGTGWGRRGEGALGKRQSRKVRAAPGSNLSSQGRGWDAPPMGARIARGARAGYGAAWAALGAGAPLVRLAQPRS